MAIRFGMLTGNAVIDCALLAWFLAQLIKVILELVLMRRFDVTRFVSSGGMPSSHSAMVVAATAAHRQALWHRWCGLCPGGGALGGGNVRCLQCPPQRRGYRPAGEPAPGTCGASDGGGLCR